MSAKNMISFWVQFKQILKIVFYSWPKELGFKLYSYKTYNFTVYLSLYKALLVLHIIHSKIKYRSKGSSNKWI